MVEVNVNLPDLPDSVDEAIGEVLIPPSKEGGRTFANLMYMLFRKPNLKAEMARLEDEAALKAYADEIENGINNIPEQRRIPARRSIIGPALEAAQYYVEEDELRSMFAKLIASSMDSDFTNIVHPSFVEIIKQLSPLDAQNLKVASQSTFLPIVDFVCKDKSAPLQQMTLHKNVFLANKDCQNISLQASSLDNLIRLGLIDISNSAISPIGSKNFPPGTDPYDIFMDHPIIKEARIFLEQAAFPFSEVSISKKSLKLTSFGHDFAKACL